MDRWISVSEAAAKIGISERAMYTRIKKGKVESKMEDGNRLVLLDSEVYSEETTEADSEDFKATSESLQKLIEEKNARILDLQTQVNQQSQQIDRQSEQLSQLTEQLDHMTQLLALAQKSVQQLSDQTKLLLEDQRKPKLSFWQRLIGQKHHDENTVLDGTT